MALLGPRVESIINNGGDYRFALGASTVFLAGTEGSRIVVASHIAFTLISGVALAVNAYRMVKTEDNKVGMVYKLSLYAIWNVSWVTNAIRNIEKDDMKAVKERITESKVVQKEVSNLSQKIADLLAKPLEVQQRAHLTS